MTSAHLGAAAELALGGWDEASEDVTAAAVSVLDAVMRVQAGEDPDLDAGEIELPHLHNRVLEALRHEILRGWSRNDSFLEGASASDVLRAVSALETVRLRLWPEGREDMVSRLSDPDAYELLVEVAHDLRSPLSSILFLAETLRSGHSGPMNGLQTSQLGLIYSAALGIVTMCNDVMELARSGHSYGQDDPSPFSVQEVFEQVHETVRPMAEEKNIALEFSPPPYDRCRGHPVLLSRVLLNLVTNALKFTEEGTVAVSADQVDRQVIEFSVGDSGPGIEPEQIECLFHVFKKSAEREGHFFSGSGLGLSIARRLVASMDSRLRVESQPGEGTRFSFRLTLPQASSF